MNKQQYDITKEWLNKFNQAISDFHIASVVKSGVDPIIAQAQLDGLKSKRDDLIEELKSYERH